MRTRTRRLAHAVSLALAAAPCGAQSLLDEARAAEERESSSAPELSTALEIREGFLDGAQTGTGFGEDYLLGVPRDLRAGEVRPLLLAWHGFGAPPRQIFRDTDYPAECAARGWFLLAPRGLDDKSFGFPPAQRNVRAVLARVLAEQPIDRRRLYAVGWSMGAQSALCFAARHREDEVARFAAVAALQGPHDLLDTYARESAPLRAWMERLFGAAPAADERPYRRSSVLRLDATRLGLASEPSYARQLLDLPLLLVHAPDDPLTYLRAQSTALGAWLRARGAPVLEWNVRGRSPAHDWRIAPASTVCAWLERQQLGPLPRMVELVSDGEASRLGVRLVPREGAAFATARVAREGGGWKVGALRGAAELHLEAGALGVPADGALELRLLRGGAAVQRVVVLGLARSPAAVWRGGRALEAPPWSAEEGLSLLAPGAAARWRIER
ncbi:MAG: prolyl oligopeptidase family serine peptidase [Planctomycetes bacterium]|nr:prolyl oligopeptidase family serine peptidase [Planctomycetota bacterium]